MALSAAASLLRRFFAMSCSGSQKRMPSTASILKQNVGTTASSAPRHLPAAPGAAPMLPFGTGSERTWCAVRVLEQAVRAAVGAGALAWE